MDLHHCYTHPLHRHLVHAQERPRRHRHHAGGIRRRRPHSRAHCLAPHPVLYAPRPSWVLGGRRCIHLHHRVRLRRRLQRRCGRPHRRAEHHDTGCRDVQFGQLYVCVSPVRIAVDEPTHTGDIHVYHRWCRGRILLDPGQIRAVPIAGGTVVLPRLPLPPRFPCFRR